MFITSVAQAQCTNPVNEKYSYKDLMNQNFYELKSTEFNNTCIIGTNFYQENKPDEDIFPDFVNVEFVKCNLDNVLIKAEMNVDDKSTKKKIKVQNDLEDWVLDTEKKPIEPINKEEFVNKGLSIDPKDIPLLKLDISKTMEVTGEEVIIDPSS